SIKISLCCVPAVASLFAAAETKDTHRAKYSGKRHVYSEKRHVSVEPSSPTLGLSPLLSVEPSSPTLGLSSLHVSVEPSSPTLGLSPLYKTVIVINICLQIFFLHEKKKKLDEVQRL
ncbi:hypothetical protein ACJX0J_035465, partial [Zea mays]